MLKNGFRGEDGNPVEIVSAVYKNDVMMIDSKILIVGAGVAGLTAALELAQTGLTVDLVEKSDFAGGHAVGFSCKAIEACVRCGACAVEEKLRTAAGDPRIRILTGTEVRTFSPGDRFSYTLNRRARFIDSARCTNCGECARACPDNAVISGVSAHQHPFFALTPDRCRRFNAGEDCQACRTACPSGAIDLAAGPEIIEDSADAVILAVGFQPYCPKDKPYGYGRFADVITNLELEAMLRQKNRVLRPSDGRKPESIAFVQCVGSRDARRGHLWCSQVCCGSALRMAYWIQARQPDSRITVFYIDIQTFGKDFEAFDSRCREKLRFVRTLPADVLAAPDGSLQLTYAEADGREARAQAFDLVVLSVGLTPAADAAAIAQRLGASRSDSGFLAEGKGENGVFVCGAAKGPMSIAQSIADAGAAAWQVRRYLRKKGRLDSVRNGGFCKDEKA